ncbi:hypothetical protein SETIT_7G265000v2 [Setaria italica]|uniref:Uncharacterized protein n=1 Tax=Setaria italica TaxID=4555 RepID=A0A368S1P0_SETIT|nr:hypothetical protein SETIT_7G265000v2 [Setaria italica]
MEQINSCREFVCPFTCFRVSPRIFHSYNRAKQRYLQRKDD